MAISKKIRFEIFKRDGFACQYCGKTPPEVTLEIDHIMPKSKNGSDDINNLITACFDCNRGKKNIELKKLPNTLLLNKDILEEKEKQYIEYQKMLKKINNRVNNDIYIIEKTFNKYYPEHEIKETFKNGSIKKFINILGCSEVDKAMEKACCYINYDSEKAIKYFCGICWNKIKGNG